MVPLWAKRALNGYRDLRARTPTELHARMGDPPGRRADRVQLETSAPPDWKGDRQLWYWLSVSFFAGL